jgi:hypothetical protein
VVLLKIRPRYDEFQGKAFIRTTSREAYHTNFYGSGQLYSVFTFRSKINLRDRGGDSGEARGVFVREQ